jgi:hypothetical protein
MWANLGQGNSQDQKDPDHLKEAVKERFGLRVESMDGSGMRTEHDRDALAATLGLAATAKKVAEGGHPAMTPEEASRSETEGLIVRP